MLCQLDKQKILNKLMQRIQVIKYNFLNTSGINCLARTIIYLKSLIQYVAQSYELLQTTPHNFTFDMVVKAHEIQTET